MVSLDSGLANYGSFAHVVGFSEILRQLSALDLLRLTEGRSGRRVCDPQRLGHGWGMNLSEDEFANFYRVQPCAATDVRCLCRSCNS